MEDLKARRGWLVTTDLRVESSYVEDGRLHVLVGLNEGAAGELFNSEAGKELRLTSPLASRSTAANCSAGIKCAGDEKPHFIKCGFGETKGTAVGLEVA